MLVKEKRLNNLLITIKEEKEIEIYKKEGISFFVLPLKGYSIGYERTFTLDEINNIKEKNKVILLNRVLTNTDIDELKELLPKIDATTFIIEDVGLINTLKKLNKKVILFINHFNCSSKSINVWLNYVDSCFISNELTKEEIETIASNTDKEICIQIFGYNQVMYSRRKLLKNFYDYYNLEPKTKTKIKEQSNLVEFNMIEDDNGTVALSDKIMSLNELLSIDNVLFYYINTSFIDTKEVLKFLNDEEVSNTDNSFLEKETIFKLGGK